MWSGFFCWDKDLGQADISHILNIFVKSTENLMFWAENVFQMSLKYVLWTLRICLEYLKGQPDLYCCPSKKKAWPHDTPIRLYVRKSERSWDFQTMKLKMRLEYSIFWQNLIFWAETLFSTLHNFEFQTTDSHIKKLTALLGLGKTLSQIVCQSDTNWLL